MSLLFAFDPPGLLQLAHFKGHAARSPFCRFRLGGSWVTIVLEPELGQVLLRWPREGRAKSGYKITANPVPLLRFFRPDVLVPLLGPDSPLLTDGVPHAVARHRLSRLFDSERITRALDNAEQMLEVELARRQLEGPEVDLAAVLRDVAVEMGLSIMGALPGVEAAQRLLHAADTAALVEPRLRHLGKIGCGRWRQLEGARAELVEHLRTAGHETAGEQDAAITMLLGLVDNPVMVTLRAVLLRRELGLRVSRSATVARAAEVSTVPLLLRQAQTHFEAAGVEFKPGDALGIDGSNLPFGAGDHQCPGRGLALEFAERMLCVVERSRLQIVDHKVRRVRLAYGISEMQLKR